MSPRIDKPLIVKVADLDDNLYLLDDQAARLSSTGHTTSW